MSVHISSLVWKLVFKDPTRKLVALALADMANDEGDCWPSLRSLVARCGLTEKSIKRHIQAMKLLWMATPRHAANGRQTSNCYTFTGEGVAHDRVEGAMGSRGEGVTHDPLITLNHQKEPKERKEGIELFDVNEWPDSLDTPEFREAWGSYKAMRAEKGKRITPTTIKHVMKDMMAWGAEAAVASLQESIKHGWTGVFLRKDGRIASKPQSKITSSQEQRNARKPATK